MSRPRLLRRGAPLALVPLLGAGLVACGGDDGEAEPPIGAVVRSADLAANNLAVVTDGDDVGTLVGTLLNEVDETDVLTGVLVETEVGPATAVLLDGPVELPHDENVRLATDQRVAVTAEDLREGRFVEVTLQFENADDLSTQVPVEPATGPYDDVEVPDADEVAAAG